MKASPFVLCGLLAACGGGGGGGASIELPPIPPGFLRAPEEWSALPVPGRDPGCTPESACAVSWSNILSWAAKWDDPTTFPDITESTDNNSDHDVIALACALAWRGSDDPEWRERCRMLLDQAVFTPYSSSGVSALRPGRNLLSYVLAANTIELPELDPFLDSAFRSWIERIAEIDRWVGDGVSTPGTFADYHQQRPNNIGLMIGASRIAVDMYLGGNEHGAHIVAAERVFRGFLGDDAAYNFKDGDFGGGSNRSDNSWQADPRPGHKEGIDPTGAIVPPGLDVDGALPEEMRRLGALDCGSCGLQPSFACYNRADGLDGGNPPGISATNYAWEALQGLVMQAYLLSRCGFDAFGSQDQAIERTHHFLYVTYGLRAQDTWNDSLEPDDPGCCDGTRTRSEVDDTWVPHIVAAIYHPSYLGPANLVYGGRPGKNCGFADWWTSGLPGRER